MITWRENYPWKFFKPIFANILTDILRILGSEKSSRFSSLGKKRTQSEPVTEIQSKRPVLTNNGKRDGGSPMVANRKFFKSRNSVEDANQKTYKSSGKERKASKHTR